MQLKLRLTRFFIFTFFSLTISMLSANSENQREELILAAKNYLGTPYRYGGASKAGIDCSGLVYMAALDSGLAALPRTARGMYNKVERISDSERQAGDLVFFSAYGLISHVGIYLGDGKFIHSASDGPSTGVIISNFLKTNGKDTTFHREDLFLRRKKIRKSKKKKIRRKNKSKHRKKTLGKNKSKRRKKRLNQKLNSRQSQKAKPKRK